MKKVFSLVVILFSIQSFAQSVIPCFTDELYVNAVRENPSVLNLHAIASFNSRALSAGRATAAST